MAFYGQIISDDFRIESLYDAFIKYFNNPNMTKVKNVGEYSMYRTKIKCLLSKESRYLVVFVDKNEMPIDSSERLSELPWISFQTLTLEECYNIQPHSYDVIAKGPLMSPIIQTTDNEDASEYKCDAFPITITLMKTKNLISPYQKKGTILQALETYNTIVMLER